MKECPQFFPRTKTSKGLNKAHENHHLIGLAQTAKIPEIIKWEFFLKEITLHLSFSYPEDDRLFFQRKNPLKAVVFLQNLGKSYLDQKEIKEAVRFCFEMYKDTLCFIAEIASAHAKFKN